MPLEPRHIIEFIGDAPNDKFNSELLDLLIKRVNKLCFDECQIDRIQCTLTPLCTRRFLLKLRIKNGLNLDIKININKFQNYIYLLLKKVFL